MTSSDERERHQRLPVSSSDWEQRLGCLIEKTGRNLNKLQASYGETALTGNSRRRKGSAVPTMAKHTIDATTTCIDAVRMLHTPVRGRAGGQTMLSVSEGNDGDEEADSVIRSLPAPPTETRINRTLPQDTWIGAAACAMSTRTRVITKDVEDTMVRRIEQSLRSYLDRLVDDRVSIKLAELESKLSSKDETTAWREKSQTASNNIARLSKELRALKQQVARQEQTMAEVQESSNSLMQTLLRQVETLTDERKKQIHQQRKITTALLPTIQRHINSLEETCIGHQSQLVAIKTRCDEMKVDLKSAYAAATSAVTNVLTPLHSKLQQEVQVMKQYVIDATEKKATSQNDVEKSLAQMQDALAADAEKLTTLHHQSEEKCISLVRSMFENLESELRNTMQSRFSALSESALSLQEEVCTTVIPSKVQDMFASSCAPKIEEQVIAMTRGLQEGIEERLQTLAGKYPQNNFVAKGDCMRTSFHHSTENSMQADAKNDESALPDAMPSTKQVEEDYIRKLVEDIFVSTCTPKIEEQVIAITRELNDGIEGNTETPKGKFSQDDCMRKVLHHSMENSMQGAEKWIQETTNNGESALSDAMPPTKQMEEDYIRMSVEDIFESIYVPKIEEQVIAITRRLKEEIEESMEALAGRCSQDLLVAKDDCMRALLRHSTEYSMQTAEKWIEAKSKNRIESTVVDTLSSMKPMEEDHVRKLVEQAFNPAIEARIKQEVERSLRGQFFIDLVKDVMFEAQSELEKKLMAHMPPPPTSSVVEQLPSEAQQVFPICQEQSSRSSAFISLRDFEVFKEQLTKSIEDNSTSFDRQLQWRFGECRDLVDERINEILTTQTTELTRIKVDTEALYRFHRTVEKDLHGKLSDVCQSWVGDLSNLKKEVESLSSCFDTGKIQVDALNSDFKNVAEQVLTCHLTVDSLVNHVSALEQQNSDLRSLLMTLEQNVEKWTDEQLSLKIAAGTYHTNSGSVDAACILESSISRQRSPRNLTTSSRHAVIQRPSNQDLVPSYDWKQCPRSQSSFVSTIGEKGKVFAISAERPSEKQDLVDPAVRSDAEIPRTVSFPIPPQVALSPQNLTSIPPPFTYKKCVDQRKAEEDHEPGANWSLCSVSSEHEDNGEKHKSTRIGDALVESPTTNNFWFGKDGDESDNNTTDFQMKEDTNRIISSQSEAANYCDDRAKSTASKKVSCIDAETTGDDVGQDALTDNTSQHGCDDSVSKVSPLDYGYILGEKTKDVTDGVGDPIADSRAITQMQQSDYGAAFPEGYDKDINELIDRVQYHKRDNVGVSSTEEDMQPASGDDYPADRHKLVDGYADEEESTPAKEPFHIKKFTMPNNATSVDDDCFFGASRIDASCGIGYDESRGGERCIFQNNLQVGAEIASDVDHGFGAMIYRTTLDKYGEKEQSSVPKQVPYPSATAVLEMSHASKNDVVDGSRIEFFSDNGDAARYATNFSDLMETKSQENTLTGYKPDLKATYSMPTPESIPEFQEEAKNASGAVESQGNSLEHPDRQIVETNESMVFYGEQTLGPDEISECIEVEEDIWGELEGAEKHLSTTDDDGEENYSLSFDSS